MGRPVNKELENAIYEYVLKGINDRGVAPSVREIAKEFDCVPSNIQRYLDRLERNGKITREGIRQITTKYNSSPMVQIPLVGKISCGTPLLAEQNIDYFFPMRQELVGSGDFFALTANGDSMIEAGIESGDIVIIRMQNYADEGQIVVALLDDEATLKRLFLDKKNRKVILHPENSSMSDMIFDDVSIQGVAVKVIKSIG